MERSVLTLVSLCLPCYMQGTAWNWFIWAIDIGLIVIACFICRLFRIFSARQHKQKDKTSKFILILKSRRYYWFELRKSFILDAISSRKAISYKMQYLNIEKAVAFLDICHCTSGNSPGTKISHVQKTLYFRWQQRSCRFKI